MLYHPCANPLEVERLKTLVRRCLWRHIITPYNYLDEDRVSTEEYFKCSLLGSLSNREREKNKEERTRDDEITGPRTSTSSQQLALFYPSFFTLFLPILEPRRSTL